MNSSQPNLSCHPPRSLLREEMRRQINVSQRGQRGEKNDSTPRQPCPNPGGGWCAVRAKEGPGSAAGGQSTPWGEGAVGLALLQTAAWKTRGEEGEGGHRSSVCCRRRPYRCDTRTDGFVPAVWKHRRLRRQRGGEPSSRCWFLLTSRHFVRTRFQLAELVKCWQPLCF